MIKVRSEEETRLLREFDVGKIRKLEDGETSGWDDIPWIDRKKIMFKIALRNGRVKGKSR